MSMPLSDGSDADELAEPPMRRQSVDGERLIALFSSLVQPLGETLPSSCEVVLHDLSRMPNSIVAIHGDVSGRRVGDEPIKGLRDNILGLSGDTVVGYYTTLNDGREICSSTMLIRDVTGNAVATLVINSDLSVWANIQKVLDTMYGRSTRAKVEELPPLSLAEPAERDRPTGETVYFDKDIKSVAIRLIKETIEEVGVPVEIMHKRHKVAVVRKLKVRGIFLLRDGVDMTASGLNVTRFTIYNYLNQLSDEE
ncbi:transcriptional regulator [Microbacterium sp. MPKO10]|uniref:helix-turn-helix transcriptional regulator n=1 Tax=Microbacterium sp. MPKO10 TaxID=2989818 RepID=UPI002235F199|nr:PAS domain-containing protein [Microbacterium sp. MPKO10]MCW4456837.1 PAS domain-containing protein [Microbacterium sp. MPKO10]